MTTPRTATPRLIPLDDIAVPAEGLRRSATSPQQDQGLRESIGRLGVLQPIIVRPQPARLGAYLLVAGRRRFRAAQELGLAEIPAEVHDALTDADAAAIEAAENMQRAAMSPVDTWRAVTALQDLGWTLDAAAEALGLGQRRARQLSQLGRLHPELIAAIERDGLPNDRDLTTIARASAEAQAAAVKKHVKPGAAVPWWKLSEALAETRVPKARAIFDTEKAGIAWTEDLFAEPGSDWQWTTTDLAGFRRAQLAELERQAEASGGKIEIVNLQWNRPVLPKGWDENWRWKWGERIPRGQVVYAAVDQDGTLRATCAKPPAKPKAEAKGKGAPAEEADDDQEEDAPARATPAAPKHRFTEAGRILIGELKTDALRAALRDRAPPPPAQLLRLLLLALDGDNVEIRGEKESPVSTRTTFADIAAAALHADPADAARISAIAAEALARILRCGPVKGSYGNMHSGAAAEWIGAEIGAEAVMPRLDREDLLKAANAEALEEACREAGIKPGKTGKATRAALVGQADGLWFAEASFAAPPPRLLVPQAAACPADCGKRAGSESCVACNWDQPEEGETPEPCELEVFEHRLQRLGLTMADLDVNEDGEAVLKLQSADTRHRDQAAIDAANAEAA